LKLALPVAVLLVLVVQAVVPAVLPEREVKQQALGEQVPQGARLVQEAEAG